MDAVQLKKKFGFIIEETKANIDYLNSLVLQRSIKEIILNTKCIIQFSNKVSTIKNYWTVLGQKFRQRDNHFLF